MNVSLSTENSMKIFYKSKKEITSEHKRNKMMPKKKKGMVAWVIMNKKEPMASYTTTENIFNDENS